MGLLLSPLVKEIAKAKARATNPKTASLGYKYQYWTPLSDHISSSGEVVCRGLYFYIGLSSFDSWLNLLSACNLRFRCSYRRSDWVKDVGVSIFSYPAGHGSKGKTCRSTQWIMLGGQVDPAPDWVLTPKEQLYAGFPPPGFIKYWKNPFARIFNITSRDPAECSIELDKVAHEIAADIDGFDWNEVDTGDTSEDEEFYPAAYRQESGTDRTAVSIGRVRYSSLRKNNHEDAVVAELKERGIIDRTKENGWRNNLQVLKTDEGNVDSFQPKIAITNFSVEV